MLAFVLVVGFPVLLGLAFGSLYAFVSTRRGGMRRFEQAAVWLYPAVLALPVAAAGIWVAERGAAGAAGLAVPAFAGLPGWGATLASVVVGVALGFALFGAELAAARALAHQTGGEGTLHRAFEGQSQEFARGQRQAGSAPLLLLSVVVVMAEEFLWRGFLLHALQTSFAVPATWAVVISSLCFGINHYYFGLRNVLQKTISGACWAGLLLATGSLLAPVVSHLVFDLVALRRMRR